MIILAYAFCDEITSTHVQTYSITNNIYSFEKEDGSGPMKSMPQQ